MTPEGHLRIANSMLSAVKQRLSAVPDLTVENYHDLFGEVNGLEHDLAMVWFELSKARHEEAILAGTAIRYSLHTLPARRQTARRQTPEEITLDDLI